MTRPPLSFRRKKGHPPVAKKQKKSPRWALFCVFLFNKHSSHYALKLCVKLILRGLLSV